MAHSQQQYSREGPGGGFGRFLEVGVLLGFASPRKLFQGALFDMEIGPQVLRLLPVRLRPSAILQALELQGW